MQWRGPHVTENDIAKLERHIGHRLPDDYRRFLVEVNGGRLDTHEGFDDGIVHTLYMINATDESEDLLALAMDPIFRPLLPSPDLLRVGYDVGSRPILLALAGEHRGGVWFENTSNARPVGSNPRVLWHDRRDMKKLANSFQEFMSSLQPL
jgi:hypothetical protein